MAYSFDPKDDVEEQWRKWQEANPPESFMDIAEDDLREQTIKDLSYVSQMDVKEYTLYQKWCEIKDKYPTYWVGDIQVPYEAISNWKKPKEQQAEQNGNKRKVNIFAPLFQSIVSIKDSGVLYTIVHPTNATDIED